MAPTPTRLNAPFGARCFLTVDHRRLYQRHHECLNAPFGARCFLTTGIPRWLIAKAIVLMHLLALGAF